MCRCPPTAYAATPNAHGSILSCHCSTNDSSFQAECEFTFISADGLQRNVFDHAAIIQRNQKDLTAGKTLAHQLEAISVEGSGCGSIEIEGTFTNGQAVVTEMQIKFNGHGHSSPVTVDLQDITLRDGTYHYDNEIVARVNALTFRQKSDPPKLEVTLASVKARDRRQWSLVKLYGKPQSCAAANMLLPAPHDHGGRPSGHA